jgi:hypothetical protein
MGSIISGETAKSMNKKRATDKYGTDIGGKFSSTDYNADETAILSSENEGKRLFNGKGSYSKAGKDDKFTMDEGTSIGKGVASRETNVAGLFGTKRQRLFS